METLDSLKSGIVSGRLSGCTSLKLCAAELTEFPIEILTLANSLTFLNLSNNCLNHLPPEFAQLTQLKVVFFNNNRFETFPTVLAQCPQLSMVSFKNNHIHTIAPPALFPNLRWLILTNNQLTSLPATIGNLPKLQKLMLAGNRLRSIPHELARCTNLELIRLSANQLESLPQELFTLPRLAWLAYAGNPCHPNDNTHQDEISQNETSQNESTLPSININDLEQQEVLGEGASGVIYKGRWKPSYTHSPQNAETGSPQTKSSPKDVAIKLFKGDITSDGSPLDEMRACIAAGAHPNLVTVLGKYRHAEKTGLIFAFIPPHYKNLGNPPSLETCTRDTYSPDTQFTIAEVHHIAKGIASVEQHLHSRNIMHGDLYAHNILIDDTGHSILGDFGAASFYDPAIIGQALEKIEIRAFGCLLEDLLERCYQREATTQKGIHTIPPSETENATKLRQLQVSCLQEDPAKRPSFLQISQTL